MKILIISDVESKYLWDYYERGRLDGIDLILSCGDLKPQYLSFLASFTKAPVLYVRGNHDDCYATTPPDGCICIEDKIYNFNGLRILGMGGSMRYKKGSNQYTENEMHSRLRRMKWKIRRNKGVDILLAHAPAAGISDSDDLAHHGFASFVEFMDTYKPKYFIHGHIHKNYGMGFKREQWYKDTLVVNGYERFLLDTEQDPEK